jgi:tripartite-type tricarboxylate transporter receptor subunit TctC
MAMSATRVRFAAVAGAFGLALMAAGPAAAQSGGDYFKGKTINVVIGGGAGDGYDIYARFLSSHLARHLPGNPRMVPQNMPGAGTLVAANYLYEVAPADGTAIGTVGGGTATAHLFRTPGVRVDPRNYHWVGSMNSEVGLVLAWHQTPFRTFNDVREREFVVGGSGPTSGNVIFPLVLNRVVGAKYKIITGYRSTGDIALAMERGEVQGTSSYHYSSMITTKPHWIRDKQVYPLAQLSLIKHPLFPNVPHIAELARNEEELQILNLIFARQSMGRPFLLPPKTPDNVVKMVRTAFNAALKDPELIAEAEKRVLDLTLPMTGEEIHALIDKLYASPPEVIEKAIAASDTSHIKG